LIDRLKLDQEVKFWSHVEFKLHLRSVKVCKPDSVGSVSCRKEKFIFNIMVYISFKLNPDIKVHGNEKK